MKRQGRELSEKKWTLIKNTYLLMVWQLISCLSTQLKLTAKEQTQDV